MNLRLVLVAIVLLLAVSAPIGAQDTGGSFGGGFDDGGSSDSSSSSDSGSSYDSGSSGSDSGSSGSDSGSSGSDSGWSSSDSSSSDSGPSEPWTPTQWKIFFAVVGVAGGLVLVMKVLDARARSRPTPPPVVPTLHLVTAQLAIDWRARRDLQERLAALARSGKAGTKQGRVELLKETVLALVRAELSWLYSSWRAADTAKTAAEGAFRAATVDARARFKREVVRDTAGVVEEKAVSTPAPSPSDGAGVVVVSLFVATNRPITAPAPNDAAALRSALQGLLALGASDLVALEVVWSPALENDRMSTAELEQLYPELALIDPASVAGRVFCAHCTGPYAKELMTCPHCGAPASA